MKYYIRLSKLYFVRWNFGRKECQLSKLQFLPNFPFYASGLYYLNIWIQFVQTLGTSCLYTTYLVKCILLTCFHPWYLHLYYAILYLVFTTNTIISVLQVYWVVSVWSKIYNKHYRVNNLADFINKISISEGLDRWVDDFANINEDMIVDQTGSHQVTENRPEDKIEGDGKRDRKYPEKGLLYQRSVLMDKRLMK